MSRMSELHHDTATLAALGLPRPATLFRDTIFEWADRVHRATVHAWKTTGQNMTYVEMYRLVDATLRHALPDVCPVDGENG